MAPERMPVRISEDASQASLVVPRIVAQIIRDRAGQQLPAVLGLATGLTPIGVYRELI